MAKLPPNTKELIEALERASKPYPFLDPEYDILVIDESEKPIIIMNREEYAKLWERITGAPYQEN